MTTSLYVDVSARFSNGQEFYEELSKPENLGAIPKVEVRLINTLPTFGFLKSRVDIVMDKGCMEYAEVGVFANGSIPSIDSLEKDPVRTLRKTIEILLS